MAICVGEFIRESVITCIDSGGILDVVQDSISGYVAAPPASSLASAMDHMMLNRSAAEHMGGRGLQSILELNISWDHVVRTLTE
jgi:glycosyltransferase involved in cell wall biosynthesis